MLKTPANQARVPTLLRMFPDAKFVHIVRDPLVLHQSFLRTYRHIIPMNQMQDVDWNEMDEFIIDAFAATMRQFIEDVRQIPEGNYVEMKFGDLESDPLGELERVYRDLGIPGWHAARQAVSDYLDTVSDYKKNVYKPSREVVDLLRDRWGLRLRPLELCRSRGRVGGRSPGLGVTACAVADEVRGAQ